MRTLREQLIEVEKTNREKAENLLEPPSRKGRIQKVDRPMTLPRRCAISGKHQDEFFLNLGFNTADFHGDVYISASIFKEMCKVTGFVPKDEYLAQLTHNLEIADLFRTTLDQNEQLKGVIRELVGVSNDSINPELSVRIDNLLHALEQQEHERLPAKRTGKEGSSDSRSDESGDGEGLADLSAFRFPKPTKPII